MNWDFKVKYCSSLAKSEHNGLVILGNYLEGNCFKMTAECYEIINECVESGKTIEEFVKNFDDDSRVYLLNLIDEQLEKGILFAEDDPMYEKCDKILQVVLMLTERCNLKCTHCCVDAKPLCEGMELTTEQWKSIIDKMDGLGLDELIFTGGEPLVREDLFELAEYAKKKLNVDLQLMTNGTLITEENADRIVELFDDFSISLDGADEESCAPVRGRGVFDRVMKGIEILKEKGMGHFSVSFTKVRQNENKEEAFCELAEKLGAFPMVRQFEVAGRAKEHLDLIPSDHMHYFDPKISCKVPEGGHFYPEKMPMCIACSATRRKIHIDSNGKIFPCQVLSTPEFEMGNILEIDSLKDYILSGEIYKSKGYETFKCYHPVHNEKCSECPAKLFCTNCLYQTYLLLNRDDKDELCRIKRESLVKLWS